MTSRTRKASACAPPVPAAIPPSELAYAQLRAARDALERARLEMLRVGRVWEAGHLQTAINDLEFRHLPWARLTACTACRGFRDGDVYTRPSKCVHVDWGKE